MEGSEKFGILLSKLLIALFLVLATVAGAWTGMNAWDYMKEKDQIQLDTKRLKEIRKIAPTVRELAKQGYTQERLQEEMRKGNWTSFFADRASAAGMNRSQYKLPRRETSTRPGYYEHFFRVGINHKSGVSRRAVARFLHAIEKSRTYLRTRNIALKRLSDSEDWGGEVIIAYREKR